MQPRTLFDKVWDQHEVLRRDDGASLLWVDRHLVHEGSHHAFAKLAERDLPVAEPALTIGVVDHYAPTRHRDQITNPDIARMIRTLEDNTARHGIRCFGMSDPRQGIVHVMGPEQGLTLPGLLINCGDSHTSTHGAFGALAFGIGATEVAHVLATQTIWQMRPKTMRITVNGRLGASVTAKDLALSWIAELGADGARGHAIEYAGPVIEDLSMEGRMTLCNLSIEGGARCGMVAPDDVTLAYLKDRPFAPTGADWDRATEQW
jgi:3-isopropylmalate/(R)-2-methylmalate dehydratase large subunit